MGSKKDFDIAGMIAGFFDTPAKSQQPSQPSQPSAAVGTRAYREDARGILQKKIDAATQHLISLKELRDAIDWDEMPDEKEADLWFYLKHL